MADLLEATDQPPAPVDNSNQAQQAEQIGVACHGQLEQSAEHAAGGHRHRDPPGERPGVAADPAAASSGTNRDQNQAIREWAESDDFRSAMEELAVHACRPESTEAVLTGALSLL